MRPLQTLWPVLMCAGLLAACAPAVVKPPQNRILANAALSGKTLTVTLVNGGPHPLLVDSACPRPFGVTFLDYPGKNTGALAPSQLETCIETGLAPHRWDLGQNLNVSIPVDYPAGSHTLKALASVRVKVTPKGIPQGEFSTLNVAVPEVTFTVK